MLADADVCFGLGFFWAGPEACGNSQPRDRTRAVLASCATAVAMPDP